MLLQEPAPRSQGCEVARVLIGLDTGVRNKFPLDRVGKHEEHTEMEAIVGLR
jgi:hypothetical protein